MSQNCETRDELLFCSLKLLLFYVLVAFATIPVTAYICSMLIYLTRNETRLGKLSLLTEIQCWIIISLFPLKGNVQEYVTVCKKRHLKKWNVSAFGSFTLRFSFITKRDFRALKNWNIDWINVTLPVSVFLGASSFADFVWSFTLLDVTSKIK